MEENPSEIDDNRISSSSLESLTRSGPTYLEKGGIRESPYMNKTGGEGNGSSILSKQQRLPSQWRRGASYFHRAHDSYGALPGFSKRASDNYTGKFNSSSQKQHENNTNPKNSTEHEEKSSCVPDYSSSYEELDKRDSASTRSRGNQSTEDVLFRLMESLEISNKYIQRNINETSLKLLGSASTTEGDSSPNNTLKVSFDPRNARRQDIVSLRRRPKTSKTMLQDIKQNAAATNTSNQSCGQKPIYSNSDQGEKLLNESRDNIIKHRRQLQQRLGSMCKSGKNRFQTPLSTSSTNQSSLISEEEVDNTFFLKDFGDESEAEESDTSSLDKQTLFSPRDVDNESQPAFSGRRKNAFINRYCSLPGATCPDSELYSPMVPKCTFLLHKNPSMERRNFCFQEPLKMEENEAWHKSEETTKSKTSPSKETSTFHISKDSPSSTRNFYKHNNWFPESKEIGHRSKLDSVNSITTLNTGSTDTTSNATSSNLEKMEERPSKFLLESGRSLSAGSPQSDIHEGEGSVIGNAGDKTSSEPETIQRYYTTNIQNYKSNFTPSPSTTSSISPSDLHNLRSLSCRGMWQDYQGPFTNLTERGNSSEVTSTCTGSIRRPCVEKPSHLQFARKVSLSSRLKENPKGRRSDRYSGDDLLLNIDNRENNIMDTSSLASSMSTIAERSCSARTKIGTSTEGSQTINKNELARQRRRLKLNKISPGNMCQNQSQSNNIPVTKDKNGKDSELLESQIMVNQQKTPPTILSADETTSVKLSSLIDTPIRRRVIKLPPLVKRTRTEEDSMCMTFSKMSSSENLHKSQEIIKNSSSMQATKDIASTFRHEIPCSSGYEESESENDADTSLELISSIECTPRDISFSEQRLEPEQLITHVSEAENKEKEEICGHELENSCRLGNDSALTKDSIIHVENESQISSDTSDIVQNMFKHNFLYYDSEESEERSIHFKVGSCSPRIILVKPINVVNNTEADCHVPETSFPHLKPHDTENVVTPMETGDFHLAGETSNKHTHLPAVGEQSPIVDKNSVMSVFQVKVPVSQEKEDSIYSLSTDSTQSVRRCYCLRRTCITIRNFFFAPRNK